MSFYEEGNLINFSSDSKNSFNNTYYGITVTKRGDRSSKAASRS